MGLRFLLVLLLPGGLPASPTPWPTPQDPAPGSLQSAHREDEEYNALLFRYRAALRDWEEQRVRVAGSVRAQQELPPHPATKMLPEFLALVGKDSGGAMGWVIGNLRFAVEDPKERLRIAKEIVPQLAARHANEDSVIEAIDGLKEIHRDLGEDEAQEMARLLIEGSKFDEVKGQGMLLQAWVITQGDAATDPARWQAAEEIYRSLLYSYPRTRAAKAAAARLCREVDQRFYDLERAWVDRLAELNARGASPEEWPKQPMHDLAVDYQPLADAGFKPAQRWANQLYPAFEQVERQGPGIAYSWLSNQLGEYYGDGPSGRWSALRIDLLTVLYRQFPTERWVFDSIRKLLPQAEVLPRAPLEAAVSALFEGTDDPRVRSHALFALAQATATGGDQECYERALELYRRVLDEYPEEKALGLSAKGGIEGLERSMPGHVAPRAEFTDAEGVRFDLTDYRGRVVMLDFFSITNEDCVQSYPSRVQLIDAYAGRPFSLIGVNVDGRQAFQFNRLAGPLGIRWRCALLNRFDPLVREWSIRLQPTPILIDAEGVIRARNLPWPEMLAMTETLVKAVETESESGETPPK